MLEENQNKTCLFFASDYHFEMMTLPYITNNLNDNKKIIVLTDNDLEESIKKVLSGTNLNKKIEKQILEIDWNNNDLEKIKEIEKLKIQKKDAVVFIKGKENYIKKINKDINNIIKNQKMLIIDCFDINEIEDNIDLVADKYEKILKTTGIVSTKNK